jgi:hypothetical protein
MYIRYSGVGGRIGWVALLGCLAAVAFGVANGHAATPAAGQHLSCAGDQMVVLTPLYDADHVEPRSPEQQVDQLIRDLHLGGPSASGRLQVTPVHIDDRHRKLAVHDGAGVTTALFAFELRGHRGWQFDHLVRCA